MRDENKIKEHLRGLSIEMNAHHNALIYTIPDIVYFKDIQGRNLVVNKAFEKLVSLSETEIRGKTDDQIFPPELASHCRQSDREVIMNAKTLRFDEEFTTNDGKTIYFETIKSPLFNDSGNVIGVVGVSRDITERRKLEDRLGLFNTLLNQSNDAIFINDPETGGFWDVNDKACSSLGYSREELLNMNVVDIEAIIPDKFLWEAHVKDLKRQGYMILEGRHKRKDGSIFPVEVNVKYIKQDKADYMVAVVRDISERKEMEERYRTIVRSSMDCFWLTDSEGRILDVNDTSCKLLDYSRKKLLTMRISDIEAMETTDETAWHIKQVKETGHDRFETKHRRKNGSVIDVEVSCNYLNIGAGLFFSFSRDISERKRVEERKMSDQKRLMQEVIDSLPGIFYLIDEHGHIERWNKCFEDVLGYSYEEIKEMNILDFIPEDEKAYIIRKMKDVFTKGRTTAEANLLSKDGGKTPYFGTGILTTINNKPYIVGVGIDISEQKKMEEELIKAQKLDSIGLLAGGIAHDFNNILTAVLGNISLSRFSLKPEDDIYNKLYEAESGLLKAQALTRQLLTFSKGGEPMKKTLSLGHVIKEATDFALRGSNVKCVYTIAEDLRSVEADEGQISQVIHNLIINADQAMPQGGNITIRCDNVTIDTEDSLPYKKGDYLRVSIEDIGIGIPREHFQKIFDPYFTTKQKGSGLGLSTAYSIIKRHDGVITVDSTLGIGTTFHIYLPVSEREVATEITGEKVLVSGKGKILLVDDEVMIRKVTGEILCYIGYKVEFAADGLEAIDLYKRGMEEGKPFDLVIMDLTIPGGMGGVETIKELQRLDPDVMAIVSSGYSDDPILSDYEKYGFKGVAAKPYKVTELSHIIYDVITNKRRGDISNQ
ncbi:MAG TPA: hypothetical protein DCR39_07050 [Nitrospiraceae bacterium]|nr:hypothetical protein [Nitrospiraceae bacterium]